jgi:hypothetical protein
MLMSNEMVVEMVKGTGKKQAEKRVWSIPLESTLLPFFTATNAQGITQIDRDAIGSPLRVAKKEDGTPRISKAGKLTIQVAKPIRDQVGKMRDSYIASINQYVTGYIASNKETFQKEASACVDAGRPVTAGENIVIRKYNEAIARAVKESQTDSKEAVKEAENIVKSNKQPVKAGK